MSLEGHEMPQTSSAPFRFFAVEVLRTRRLSPSLSRVTFTGTDLDGFASGGRDQSFSLFLPQPGQHVPVLPTEAGERWFAAWRAMDPEVRALMRSYTIREQRQASTGEWEVDVDFALHGETGPASRWALHAVPGDRATLLGPTAKDNKSVTFRPPPSTDWVLITADETALPAVAGVLDWLPSHLPAEVWIEVPDAADARALPAPAHANVNWLVHGGSPERRGGLSHALADVTLPRGTPYAWLAGEASGVRALRRHLVSERGMDRRAVTFTGYWRLGASEEDVRREALA